MCSVNQWTGFYMAAASVMEGLMYFLIFQPEDMLKLCLNFNESHAYICFCKYFSHPKSFTLFLFCFFNVYYVRLTVLAKLHNLNCQYHCVKSFQIRSFFWPVLSHTSIEYGKIRTRKNSL